MKEKLLIIILACTGCQTSKPRSNTPLRESMQAALKDSSKRPPKATSEESSAAAFPATKPPTEPAKALIEFTDFPKLQDSFCFIAQRESEVPTTCEGCDVLRFDPGGAFDASIGCDKSLNGAWYIQDVQGKGTYTKTSSCAHTIPYDKINDEKWVAEHCAEMEKPSKDRGNFVMRFRDDGSVTVIFSGYNAPVLNGRIYKMRRN